MIGNEQDRALAALLAPHLDPRVHDLGHDLVDEERQGFGQPRAQQQRDALDRDHQQDPAG